MKRIFLYKLIIFLTISCDREDNFKTEPEPESFKGPYIIANGCYMGHFSVKNQKLWSEICLDTLTHKYVEWPSGGIAYQKEMGCLTVGTWSIDSTKLTFVLDSLKFKIFPCPLPESKLPGEYKIIKIVGRDSLIFEKGTGDNHIIYIMKRVWPL